LWTVNIENGIKKQSFLVFVANATTFLVFFGYDKTIIKIDLRQTQIRRE